MNMRASELGNFLHLLILKRLISFNVLLVLQIICLRNIYIFRSPITSPYILIQSMQFPVITYGIWHYNINGNMPTKH